MANEFKIEVHKRELSAKKSDMKNLRKEQKIPGIFYSFDSKDSIPLYIDQKTFGEASKSGAKIFNIVLFPQPLGPSIQINSPAVTLRFNLLIAFEPSP